MGDVQWEVIHLGQLLLLQQLEPDVLWSTSATLLPLLKCQRMNDNSFICNKGRLKDAFDVLYCKLFHL